MFSKSFLATWLLLSPVLDKKAWCDNNFLVDNSKKKIVFKPNIQNNLFVECYKKVKYNKTNSTHGNIIKISTTLHISTINDRIRWLLCAFIECKLTEKKNAVIKSSSFGKG